jgi:hypothetical protein
MAIPSICPRSKIGSCKGYGCPMYVIEWRSKEEYCSIDYYPESEKKVLGTPVIDNYAADILCRIKEKTTTSSTLIDPQQAIEKLQRPADIRSGPGDKIKKPTGNIKKSKKFMKMDNIPDDYEKKFWK